MKRSRNDQSNLGNTHSKMVEKISRDPGFIAIEKMYFLCGDEEEMASKAVNTPGRVILKKLSQKDIAIAQGVIKECQVKIKRLTEVDIDQANRRGRVDIGTQAQFQCGAGYIENVPGIQIVDQLMARFDQLERVLSQIKPGQAFVQAQTERISDEFEPASVYEEPM